MYNQKTGEFSTTLGPVFTHLLLADEINRAPPKVQSTMTLSPAGSKSSRTSWSITGLWANSCVICSEPL
jgi:hypothetical protein